MKKRVLKENYFLHTACSIYSHISRNVPFFFRLKFEQPQIPLHDSPQSSILSKHPITNRPCSHDISFARLPNDLLVKPV